MIIFRYLQINVMAAMEYKTALTLTTIGRILSSLLEVVSLFFLFDRFNSLLSYTVGEVGLCYLTIRLSHALAHSLGTGFSRFGRLIRRGEFDSLMVRPRSLVLQVFGSDLDPNDFFVALQYMILLFFFVCRYFPDWTLAKTCVLILMNLGGTAIFLSTFMISASLCFFTVKGMDFVQLFSEGGMRLASYPLSIYKKWVGWIFTIIIPFGFINILPLQYITDKTTGSAWLYALSPLAAVLYMIPCLALFRWSLQFYRSTGS